jgi:hypothetical protein
MDDWNGSDAGERDEDPKQSLSAAVNNFEEVSRFLAQDE